MTNNDESLPGAESDPEVSTQYRALAKETTPGRLDKIVLRAAGKAVRRDKPTGWGATWYRPVTFAATLGLSFALLLEISEFQFFDSPPDLTIQADAHPDGNAFRDAADSAAIILREVDATADESLQLSSPEASSTDAVSNPVLPASAAAALHHCSDEQMALPEMWWQCIQELREAGHGAAAKSELDNLQESFPQFMPAN
jgi:hypothetical protein